MPNAKVEDLIRKFTRDLHELVRAQLRDEITRALQACFAGRPSPARAPGRARRAGRAAIPSATLPATVAAAASVVPPTVPDSDGRRRAWTRESVVAELSTWLLTGQVIEAAYLTKHGTPGLVAAARKHFGRFDAALNAANVHLARLHPEGPPTANRRMRQASR